MQQFKSVMRIMKGELTKNQKIMRRKTPGEATGDHQKPKNLIRSQYKDIMVKIDEDIYYLDRLILALESGYFEKIFIEDYADKNCELVEIAVMDTDTFSAVVDIIYGRRLEYVINSNNYVSLLMAMDYLQMEIDSVFYKSFVKKLLYLNSPLNMDVFRLYHFVAGNENYECVLPIIFDHLSRNMKTVKDLDEFLLISFDHFLKIILVRDYEPETERLCCKFCAKWICHDLENRLPHTISIVNAIKYRLELPFDLDDENLGIPLPAINEQLNKDTMSRYLHKLLEYNGPICSAKTGIEEQETCWNEKDPYEQFRSRCSEFEITFSYSRYSANSDSKLKTFLKDGNLCDIIVKADGKKYKLHRLILKSACGYFEEIFSSEYNEIAAKCEGVPPLPSMNQEYCLDDIDQMIFDIVVDYIYSWRTEFNADVIFRVLKAAHILRCSDLIWSCERWMMKNSETICARDVIEILNFTYDNVEYKDLNRFFLSKYIVDSWPEIDNLPQFADLFNAITVPEEASDCSGKKKTRFNNIDQGTFQLIINYIYRDELDLQIDNIARILRASEIFKMKELMGKCVTWLNQLRRPTDLNSEDLKEVLRVFTRNNFGNALKRIYSVNYIMQWPEIDNSVLCSFSYEALEDVLISPDLYFDDPYKILDICSKWITHDMENRYHLVPRIALAISRNGLVDCNDYTIESLEDLNNCSQDFVKSKLLEILFTTCVIPPAISSNQEKNFNLEQSIFIISERWGRTFSILNSDLDEITSLHICKYTRGVPESMSATIINDNLFLMCSSENKSFFHVYNFSLKKTFSLASDSRISTKKEPYSDKLKEYTLLNCCNEIYCCIEDGKVLKYSFELNRWKLLSESEPDKNELRFTSDGNILYRMYKVAQSEAIMNYIMEAYNVEQNSWIFLPNVPVVSHPRKVREGSNYDVTKYKLIYMKDFGFALLFSNILHLLKQNAERWRTVPYLPNNTVDVRVIGRHWTITQDETGELLYMLNNKLHRFSRSDQEWQLKRELPLSEVKYYFSTDQVLPYRNIIAIHKPMHS